MNPFIDLFKAKGPGPIKWCKRCSRVHRARACELVEVKRTSKKRLNKDGTLRRGGHKVVRLAHPKSARKKTRARKT